MKMMKASLAICAALAQHHAVAAAKLDSMAACMAEGQYRVDGIQRLQPQRRFRTVDTAQGQVLVGALDGYRMQVHGDGNAPFANLKFEASHDQGFDADRKAIRGQMDQMAATAKGIGPQAVQVQEQDGIETWMLENPAQRPKQGAGMYTLLHPATKVIATLYLFNQGEVGTPDEFQRDRNRLLTQVRSCLQRGRSDPKA
ncbi:MAG: hypothetical protein K0R43_2394 [Pseudoduganella sp.]|jgi:hypothetical protein|nr:hypothetical protein [Pseudoduganella sp.]